MEAIKKGLTVKLKLTTPRIQYHRTNLEWLNHSAFPARELEANYMRFKGKALHITQSVTIEDTRYWVVRFTSIEGHRTKALFPDEWLEVYTWPKSINEGSIVKLRSDAPNIGAHSKALRQVSKYYFDASKRLSQTYKSLRGDEIYAIKVFLYYGIEYCYVSRDRNKKDPRVIFPAEWLTHIATPDEHLVAAQDPTSSEVPNKIPLPQKPKPNTVTRRKYSTYVYEFINKEGQRLVVPPPKGAKKKLEHIIRDTWSSPVVDGAALSHLHDAIRHKEGRCWLNDMQHIILIKYKIARYVQYEIDEIVYADDAVKESYTDLLKELR